MDKNQKRIAQNRNKLILCDFLLHYRIETRKTFVINDLGLVFAKDHWANLKSIIKIESEVYKKKTGETSTSERFYISSKEISAKEFGNHVRNHWAIESMHWSLDVIYNEDFQAKRNKNGIQNFNTLCKCAISLLTDEKTFNQSKPKKHQRAFALREYREAILKL